MAKSAVKSRCPFEDGVTFVSGAFCLFATKIYFPKVPGFGSLKSVSWGSNQGVSRPAFRLETLRPG